MAWKFNSEAPVSKQIADRLRLDIISGKYERGSQFPTVRALAIETAVNPNTVQKALVNLEDEGLLVTQGTVGRFVTDDEKILAEMKRDLQKKYIERVICEASLLGITREDFLEILKNEEVEQ